MWTNIRHQPSKLVLLWDLLCCITEREIINKIVMYIAYNLKLAHIQTALLVAKLVLIIVGM